jgi:hypothetical protein
VVTFAPRTISPATIPTDSSGSAGWIGFRGAAGEAIVGIAGARAFPIKNDAPVLMRGVELAATQVGARMDAKPWLRQPDLPPEVFLAYDLIVRRSDGAEEYRQGWTRFDVVSLRTRGMAVDVQPGRRVVLDARTKEGQPVPGALVVVDPIELSQSGLASQFAVTAEDGTLALSGLDPEGSYRASLADGVGPDPRPVVAVIEPSISRLELRSQLAGRWTFVCHRLLFATPGASTRVEEISAKDPACTGVWAVERWVPPGRGLDAPFWVMLPAVESPSAIPGIVSFSKRDPVEVPDLRHPVCLTFSLVSSEVRAFDPGLLQPAKEQSHPSSEPR